jgi:hypothetical protein
MSRHWAMPNAETFTVPVIGDWVSRHIAQSKVSVDPFARDKRWATYTNDLNPDTAAEYHMEAREFLQMLVERGVKADLLIFDPPYSPRQIAEVYQQIGRKCSLEDTQNARLYAECKRLLTLLAAPGCVALSFGWNSSGMGSPWTQEDVILVCHGSAHNDTICVKDVLHSKQEDIFN